MTAFSSHYGTSILLNTKLGFWGLIILMCWQQIGYMMIIYIAGLQAVPEDMLEAAKIDGANKWQTLWKVTIPNVMPSITICMFLTLTNGFKLFDQNLALTGGQPYIINPDGTSVQYDGNARAQHLQHLLWAEYERQRYSAGEGSAVLHPRGGNRSDSAQRNPEKGGPAVMKNSALSKEKQAKRALTIFFAVLCVFYVMPVLLVLLNSFKVNTFVKTDTFGWPSGESFAGWSNFVKGMTFGNYPFWKSALYSTVITILSTALILLFTSMAAWYISRVNSLLCRVIVSIFACSRWSCRSRWSCLRCRKLPIR